MPDERTGRDGEPLVRKHLWLSKEDMVTIDGLYGETIGVSKFIRIVLKNYLKTIREKAEQQGRVNAPTTEKVDG